MKNQYVYFFLSVAILLVRPAAIYAAGCSTNNGDASISVIQEAGQGLLIGKVVAPDSGSSTVEIDQFGNRTMDSNLNINENNKSDYGDVVQAATVKVFGEPNCSFSIAISNVNTARVSSVSAPVSGTLSNTGEAEVSIGAIVKVNSNDGSNLSDSFKITVTYN